MQQAVGYIQMGSCLNNKKWQYFNVEVNKCCCFYFIVFELRNCDA